MGGMMGGGIGMILGWLVNLLLIALVIWGVFWLVRRAGSMSKQSEMLGVSGMFRSPLETPLQILQRRFAQGEIDAEQYSAMKAKLDEK